MSSDNPACPNVWVLGEALMDCIMQSDGHLRPLLGGSPYNLACAAALQGVKVGYLNRFSEDSFGDALLKRLQACGAQSMLSRSQKPTSLAVVQVREGQPSYGFYREGIADRDYAVGELVDLLKQSTPGVLHTGSLMAMPPEHSKVLDVISAAKDLGWTISIDVNLRPKLASDLNAYLNAVRDLAAMADWLKASDEDLELLGFNDVSYDNAEHLAQHWVDLGCSRVALTFGADGAYLKVGEVSAQGKAPEVSVIDTVGAGDTFWGNCLADWVLQSTISLPHVASERTHLTLSRAMKAAAINCSRAGCQPPTAIELN
jgi:fructokinase